MGPARSRFRHEALLYEGVDGFVADVSGFVREGLAAGEAVLVAAIEEHAGPLRAELGAAAAEVDFLPIAEVGRNPARIIPAWQDWIERAAARATAFRAIGEPVWAGRSELEIRECAKHEHLLDTAFANGPPWRLLCPYDVAGLPESVVAGLAAAHRTVRGNPSGWHGADVGAQAGRDPFGVPSPRLGPPLFEAPFGFDELPGLRRAIELRADPLGLSGRRLTDFVLVADELACNSVRHGGGRGSIALWAHDGHAVVEVADSGLIADPLAGRRRPDFRVGRGAGLWTANQLCDLLLIHSTAESGTTVRAYLDTSPSSQPSGGD